MPVRQRRARWILLGCLLLLTLPAVATRPHTADEIEYFSFLRSAWVDRDLSFDNEYRYFYDHGFTTDPGFKATFIDATTATGLRPTFATIGAALLWLPFYAAADLGVRIAQALGSTVPADGFSRPYLTAVAWGSVCYGWLALVLSASLARRLTGQGWRAAVAVGVGTPLIYYMYAQPGFAHACSAFAVALFVWTWMRVRETWSIGGVAALAALGALMAMVREQDAFIVIAPAVDYAWATIWGRRGAGWVIDAFRRLVVAAVVFALCFAPQAIAYVVVNGRLGPSEVVANKMVWRAPWAPNVVLSLEHGWFVWTPLALIAVAGLVMMTRAPGSAGATSRRIGAVLLVTVATQIYVSGSVATWTLAGAFGQRRFVGLTVCLVVGVGWLVGNVRARLPRAVLASAIAICVWWNLALAVQFGEHSMDRQRIELGRNAYTAFVDLPIRLPAIAYRYLFDRASFYESPARPGQ